MKQKITPTLWYDTQAEEAMNFYVSTFKNSRVGSSTRYGAAGPGPEGSVMSCSFQLEGQAFLALNGGPNYSFTPATSFLVDCATQGEVDELREKLSAGGQPVQCGWLTDRFRVSWQIVPSMLGELLNDPDPVKSQRVMRAMLGMIKLDIAELQRNYAQP